MLNEKLNLFRSLINTGFGRSFPRKALIQNEDGLEEFFVSVLITDYSKEDPSQMSAIILPQRVAPSGGCRRSSRIRLSFTNS